MLTATIFLPDGLHLEMETRRGVRLSAEEAGLVRLLDAGRVLLLALAASVLVLALRGLLFLDPRHVQVKPFVITAILGAALPILSWLVVQAGSFVRLLTQRLTWQTHRAIEEGLRSEDRKLTGFRASLEEGLRAFADSIATGSDPTAADLARTGLPPSLIKAAYVLDQRGDTLRAVRDASESPIEQQRLARTMVHQINAFWKFPEPGGGPAPPVPQELAFVQAIGKNVARSMGRLCDFQGMDFPTHLMISWIPPRRPGERFGHLVQILNPTFYQRWLLRRLVAERARSLGFGIVGMGAAGPRWSRPGRLLWNPDLVSLCERVFHTRQAGDQLLTFPSGHRFVVTAVASSLLDGLVLVGCDRYAPIRARAAQVVVLAGIGILLLLGISVALASSLGMGMVGAIGRLTAALQGIRDGRFDVAPGREPDELGNLQTGIALAAHTLEEIYAARPVQKTLIFTGEMSVPGLELSARYLPRGFLGGDYLEARRFPSGRVLFAIGEVSAQAIPATLLIAQVKMALAYLGEREGDPAAILGEIQLLFGKFRHRPPPMSLLIGVKEPGSARLAIANAGFCLPLLLRPGGWEWVGRGGLPLGRGRERRFPEATVDLAAETALVLYSNGWLAGFEAGPGQDAYEELAALICSARHHVAGEWADRIPAAFRGRFGDRAIPDDRSLVILTGGTAAGGGPHNAHPGLPEGRGA